MTDSLLYRAQVKPEDLKVFDNVAYIDASINSLSLGDYSYASRRFISKRPMFCASDRKCLSFFHRVFQQFCVFKRTQSVIKRAVQPDVSRCWLPSARGEMTAFDTLIKLVLLPFFYVVYLDF